MMRKSKVLIVEDQSIVAKDIEKTLSKLGYSVTGIAFSGEDAIKQVDRNKPDVILMDIVLRGRIDGIDATNLINKKYKVPVVFLTAYSDKKTKTRVRKTENFGFLTKPFQEGELHSAIEFAVSNNQGTKKNDSQEDEKNSELKTVVICNEKKALELLDNKKSDEAVKPLEENVEIGTSSSLTYDLLLNAYDIEKEYDKIIKTLNSAIIYCGNKKFYRDLKKKLVVNKMLLDINGLDDED